MMEPSADDIRPALYSGSLQPGLLFIFGGLFSIVGLSVRIFARKIAWPREWFYTGDRADTSWAYNEGLYIDLSLFVLSFGMVLFLIGVWRVVR